jgi:hypothetical protein
MATSLASPTLKYWLIVGLVIMIQNKGREVFHFQYSKFAKSLSKALFPPKMLTLLLT